MSIVENRNPIDLKAPFIPFQRGELAVASALPHEAQDAILAGLELKGVVDSRAVVLSSLGSIDAITRAIGGVCGKEKRTMVWGTPYGYPLANALTKENNLTPRLLSDKIENPRESLARVSELPAAVVNESFFAIDYPTNPTGESFPAELEAFVTSVGQRGGRCVVDLAYGGYLAQGEYQRTARLVLENGGIVSSSLSKIVSHTKDGFAILPREMVKKGVTIEPEPQLASAGLCVTLFDSNGANEKALVVTKLGELGDRYEDAKPPMITTLQSKGLTVLGTNNRTPILTVVSDDPSFHTTLQERGISTYPSSHFESVAGLGQRAVRMTVPEPTVLADLRSRMDQ